MTLEHVTDRVFAATGWRGCNPGYVVTAAGIVAVDSPQLPSHAVAMRREILDRGPLRYRINTEHHIDHVFGNHFFADLAPLVGHRAVSREMWKPIRGQDPYDYMLEVVQADDPAGLPLMPPRDRVQIRPPDITFTERLVLRVGGHTFELIHTPGHTAGQLAVHVPEERVVFVGDTVFSGCQTWLHASDPDQWLRSLAVIAALNVDRIVPGHGPVCGRDSLVQQGAVIREWMAAVAAGMARGWSKSECVARISFLDRWPMDVGQEASGPMVQRLNVERLYDHLAALAA
jgi:cyclase